MQNKQESGEDHGESLYFSETQKGGSNIGTNLEAPQLDFSTVVTSKWRTGGESRTAGEVSLLNMVSSRTASSVLTAQVSSSPQTAGCCHRCCHSSHCCHRCCHSSHCCHRCYHIQSCDDGDGEICGACGDSDSSHHRQSCSSPRSLNHSSPWNSASSRKRQEGT